MPHKTKQLMIVSVFGEAMVPSDDAELFLFLVLQLSDHLIQQTLTSTI